MEWDTENLRQPLGDPQAWEHDCILATRRYLEASHGGLTLEDVRCEGEWPTTKLIVEVEGTVTKRRVKFVYDLWGRDFEVVPGARESPDGVGGLVSVWVAEDATAC
jgi:hypothetical protein